MIPRDWVEWHRDYDDPGSLLSRRAERVQGHLRAELERAPVGEVRLISLCAGQGRDVIGVLTGHPRRDDVRARLIELDERNVALARQVAQAAGLDGVEVLQADAGVTDACAGAVPAQIVMACGIFGNITGSDIQATVAALPSLCEPGALVLWTRHRSARPDSRDPVLVRGGRLSRGGIRQQRRRLHVGRSAPADGRAHGVRARPAAIHLPGRSLTRRSWPVARGLRGQRCRRMSTGGSHRRSLPLPVFLPRLAGILTPSRTCHSPVRRPRAKSRSGFPIGCRAWT